MSDFIHVDDNSATSVIVDSTHFDLLDSDSALALVTAVDEEIAAAESRGFDDALVKAAKIALLPGANPTWIAQRIRALFGTGSR